MQSLSDHLAAVTTEIEHNDQKKTHAQAHVQKIHSLQFSIGSGGSSGEYNAPVETVKGLSEPDKFKGKNYSLVSNRVGTTRAPLVLLPLHHIDAQRTHIYNNNNNNNKMYMCNVYTSSRSNTMIRRGFKYHRNNCRLEASGDVEKARGTYILYTRCLNGYSVEALTAMAAAAAAAAEAAAYSVGSTSKALEKNNNNKIVIEGENSKSV